nr:hypothetical protein [Methylocucumis oryzae]
MTVINTPNGFNINDAGRRVVVDPVTRIEGHMRCEVNIDDDNIIRNAVSSGTMWRGLEVILKGRDPRDAWAFCTTYLRCLYRYPCVNFGTRRGKCVKH